jgi:hypothetical protein
MNEDLKALKLVYISISVLCIVRIIQAVIKVVEPTEDIYAIYVEPVILILKMMMINVIYISVFIRIKSANTDLA